MLFVLCWVCACLDLSVSSSSWGLGRAAVCDCGTPWTFLLPFFEIHCRARHYTFQIRKCDKPDCCLPAEVPKEELCWLPDPVLDDSGCHFKPYEDVKSCPTTEDHRPSLKVVKKPKTVVNTGRTKPAVNVGSGQVSQTADAGEAAANTAETASRDEAVQAVELPFAASSMCSVQNARSTVTCIECRKPSYILEAEALRARTGSLGHFSQ